MPAKDIAKMLGRARSDGKGWWRCKCPCCHTEHRHRPMLCLKDGEHGGLKIKCWSDCPRSSIETALIGMGVMTLAPRDRSTTFKAPTPPPNIEGIEGERIRRLKWLATNV